MIFDKTRAAARWGKALAILKHDLSYDPSRLRDSSTAEAKAFNDLAWHAHDEKWNAYDLAATWSLFDGRVLCETYDNIDKAVLAESDAAILLASLVRATLRLLYIRDERAAKLTAVNLDELEEVRAALAARNGAFVNLCEEAYGRLPSLKRCHGRRGVGHPHKNPAPARMNILAYIPMIPTHSGWGFVARVSLFTLTWQSVLLIADVIFLLCGDNSQPVDRAITPHAIWFTLTVCVIAWGRTYWRRYPPSGHIPAVMPRERG